MANNDRRAALLITSLFAQPMAHVSSSAVADNFSNFTGSFSADGFIGGVWVLDKIKQKRKLHSVAEFTPKHRVRSLFYQKHADPASADVCFEASIRRDFSKKGKSFLRRCRVPYCAHEDICALLRDEGHH